MNILLSNPLVQQVVTGMVAASLLEAAKRWDGVPINSGNAALINSIVAVIGIISGLATAAVQHQLSGFDFNTAIAVGGPALVTIGASLGTYFAFLDKGHAKPPATLGPVAPLPEKP